MSTTNTHRRQPAHRFFASCPTGLEDVLREEIQELGGLQAEPRRGGVSFQGPLELCYRVNLESRLASRVLWRVHHGPYRTEGDVRDAAYALAWPEWFEPACTIKVKVSARSCPLRSLDYVTLTIKDAVCDRFRDGLGRRPSVDTSRPDIRIEAFLDATHQTLYLDTSGEPLFKRGYRTGAVEAPLRENLAAGLVRLAKWTPDQPLLDPMCGGATILIEAARLAQKVAPGLGRPFAFERLGWFDRRAWERELARSRSGQRRDRPLRIEGRDIDQRALACARDNLAAAGLSDVVQLRQGDVLELTPPQPPGLVITNPPYGVRMQDGRDLAEFYARLGTALKQRFTDWRVYILTANRQLPGLLRLSASRRIPLYNGALECRLMEFRMVRGSMRRQPHPRSAPP